MPPQNNRRANYGNEPTLSPSSRSFQQQDLTNRPANTDGPDLNEAKTFEALSHALNIGVQAVGQYAKIKTQENDDALRRDLVEAEMQFKKDGQWNGYDAVSAKYADDDRRMTMISNAMNRSMDDSGRLIPARNVGQRLFGHLQSEDARNELKQRLDGVGPLDEQLGRVLEADAQELLGDSYANMDDRTVAGMIGVGEGMFRAEIKEDRELRAQAAATADLQTRDDRFTLSVIGPEIDSQEVVSASIARYGATASGAASTFSLMVAEGKSVDDILSVRDSMLGAAQYDAAAVHASSDNAIQKAASKVGRDWSSFTSLRQFSFSACRLRQCLFSRLLAWHLSSARAASSWLAVSCSCSVLALSLCWSSVIWCCCSVVTSLFCWLSWLMLSTR